MGESKTVICLISTAKMLEESFSSNVPKNSTLLPAQGTGDSNNLGDSAK